MTPGILLSGLFAVTLTGSAALLFIAEPMIARMLLPVAGGAAAVWTTCLVFFQVALLGGYFYAHLSARRLSLPLQVTIHVVLLLAALVVVPLDVEAFGSPAPGASPIAWLLRTLTLTVGLPFLVLAGTTPLAQSWFSRAGRTANAYVLYSASNFGSVAGLIAYPALIEPKLNLNTQSRAWTIGYLVVLALIAICGVTAHRSARGEAIPEPSIPEAIPRGQRLRWILLAALPSSLTLSVTTFISTDIAAIPLIWVAPLALYLVSFIVAFAWPGRGRWAPLFVPIAILPPIISILIDSSRPAWLQIPAHLLTFFIVSLACHQRLARSRPTHSQLPEFYLWLALGGAIGAVATALVAPLVLQTPLEYPIGLLAACLLASARTDATRPRFGVLDAVCPLSAALLVVALAGAARFLHLTPGQFATRTLTFGPPLLIAVLVWPWPRRYVLTIAAIVAVGGVAGGAALQTLAVVRNFYGIHRVQDDDQRQFHLLVSGSTIHGVQWIDPARRREALAYYSSVGPAGEVFDRLRREGRLHDVAVLGLGVGTLACYGEPGQRWTFFELDPAVVELARRPAFFTYLSDSPVSSEIDIVVGDGRLALAAREAAAYDLIVVDVFSSDAIPVHMLTREAFEVYASRLKAGGSILFHTSNLYFNLRTAVSAAAASIGMASAVRHHQTDDTTPEGVFPSEWILASGDAAQLQAFLDAGNWQRLEPDGPAWTDDHGSLLSALTWKR